MKYNKFLITLALCALIQSPMIIGSQEQQTQTYWQQYAPQTIQNIGSAVSQKATSAYESTRDYAASWVPQSIKDRVNTWSTKKKMAVAAATLGALLAIYNREYLMQTLFSKPWQKPQEPKKPIYLTRDQLLALELPTDKIYRVGELGWVGAVEKEQEYWNGKIKRQKNDFVKQIKDSRKLSEKILTLGYDPIPSLKEEYSGDNATTEKGIAFWLALKELGLN